MMWEREVSEPWRREVVWCIQAKVHPTLRRLVDGELRIEVREVRGALCDRPFTDPDTVHEHVRAFTAEEAVNKALRIDLWRARVMRRLGYIIERPEKGEV